MKANKKKLLVSVIVTTYNRKKLLKETIDSILNQTFRDFELIVVDNFSGYDFFAHINSFKDKRIKAYQKQNDGIIAVNRNYGIKKAKGEYIAFCDDDDLWEKHKLELQLRHFEDSEIVGVGTGMTKIGDLKYHRNKKISDDLALDFDGLLRRQTAGLSSLVVRNLGFKFDESEDFKFVEDFDFQLALTLDTQKKIKILSEPLLYYRVHQSNDSKELRNVEKGFNVLQKYSNNIPKDQMRLLYARVYFNLGIKALRIKEYNCAKSYFRDASLYGTGIQKHTAMIMAFCMKFPGKMIEIMFVIYYKIYKI